MKRAVSHVLSMAAVLAVSSSCKERIGNNNADTSEAKAAAAPGAPVTEIDTAMGESLWDNEVQSINGIRDSIVSHIEPIGQDDNKRITLHPPQSMKRRDAHPKAHGCVEAEFKVVPNQFSKGLFAQSSHAPFKSVIRFSNGNGMNPDIQGDGRGMAVKVFDVQGERLVQDGLSTQDFVMINYPAFFSDDPATYLPIIEAVSTKKPLDGLRAAGVVLRDPLGTGRVLAALTTIKILNPVQEQYWSEVPYRLGESNDPNRIAMKFSAAPVKCKATDPGLPSKLVKDAQIVKLVATALTLDGNYLRKAMEQTLNERDVCYDFMVQPRVVSGVKDPDSVEDPKVFWQGDLQKVAEIRIPVQKFNTAEKDLQCEKMSFSPWDGISTHRPLGGVNRARKVVYEAVSAARHGG